MACCNDVRLNCTQGQSCSWIARLFGFYDINALPIMPKIACDAMYVFTFISLGGYVKLF